MLVIRAGDDHRKCNGRICGFSGSSGFSDLSEMKVKMKSDFKNGFLFGLREVFGAGKVFGAGSSSKSGQKCKSSQLVPLWFWLMTSFLVTLSTVNCQGEHELLFIRSLFGFIFLYFFFVGNSVYFLFPIRVDPFFLPICEPLKRVILLPCLCFQLFMQIGITGF